MPTKEEQINALSAQLLKLLETPDEPVVADTQQFIKDNTKDLSGRFNIHEDFKHIGVDVPTVRKIMKRVDEVYGKAENYIVTDPLYNSLPDDK